MMREYSLYFSWIVAVIATGGSLFFSEFMLFEPCRLCWYQRVAMYPLVVLLGIAAYKQDRGIVPYAQSLSAIGLCIALYHYLVQKIPGLGDSALCQSGVPCSGQYMNVFGFVTIPFLALLAFSLILLLLWLGNRQARDE